MSIKIRKNRKYKELSTKIANIFKKFGYVRLDEYVKPYYINYDEGRVYRVIDTNKLKEMRDGAKKGEYGYLKLKCADGTTEIISTHKLVVRGSIPNTKRKTSTHHIDGDASNNGKNNLLPVRGKEHWKADSLRRTNSPEYSEFIESIRRDNKGE